jgi:hypothetical protein
MQIALLLVAVLVCPIAFVALVTRMKAQGIEKPPITPMFFLFGTIGGWFLAFALSPSGLAAMCIVFLVTAAPIALFVASVGLSTMKNRTIYHRIAMWSGFSYPAVLGLFVAVSFLLDRVRQAEQGVAHQRAISFAITAQPPSLSRPWAHI